MSGFVEGKLIGRLANTVAKLVAFEGSKAAYLLRVSYSIVRAVHFMRTPLRQWQKQGSEFDSMVREAASSILGHHLS